MSVCYTIASGSLHGCLEGLPVEFREVMIPRELEELPYKEISGRLAGGRKRLQRCCARASIRGRCWPADIVSAHIRSLAGPHLLDVPSSDHGTVKPWFNGKLDFSPEVKDVDGFPLLGGRLEYLEGHPVAALIYGRRNHVINLFTWALGRVAGVGETRNGYQIESWSGDGMAFWVVSDLNEGELRDFVRRYRQN